MKLDLGAVWKEMLPKIEKAVDAAIEARCDETVDQIIEMIEKTIPGKLDDFVLERGKPALKASIKATLLKLADGISSAV